MKVAVIANGNVGKAVFRELQMLREINELVLVGRDVDACVAEAEDYRDGIPLRVDMAGNVLGGGYEACEGADILVYCAGPSIGSADTDRLAIVNANVEVMKEVFDEVDKYAPNAIVVAVSNPLDVIVTAITEYTRRPSWRVIGTGTLLDTSRLVRIISWATDVSHLNIGGFVLGEHGFSSVPIFSKFSVMGMTLEEFLPTAGGEMKSLDGKHITEEMRDAGYKVFRGKGYTSSAVATAVTRIVYDIVNDTQEVIPVSTVCHGEYGAVGVAMSVPCQIGKAGVVAIRNITLTDDEREQLAQSAKVIKDTYDPVRDSCRKNFVRDE